MTIKSLVWTVVGVAGGVAVWLIGCSTPAARHGEDTRGEISTAERPPMEVDPVVIKPVGTVGRGRHTQLQSDVPGAVVADQPADGNIVRTTGNTAGGWEPFYVTKGGTSARVIHLNNTDAVQVGQALQQHHLGLQFAEPVAGRTETPGEVLARVSAGEELWIIATPASVDPPSSADDDTPPGGALLARLPDAEEDVPVPLKHTAVDAAVSGYIARVGVQQQFHNPYDQKIEAVYVFPLPHDAAVNEFVMTVGDRRIRGIIREKEEAEQIYVAARSRGHVAALMTQQRPNIFTQKVANIEPGRDIDVDITYFNTLRYVDGAYEFVFPMVVGPRFNPPASTDPIAPVARGGAATQTGTAIEYLAPHERSGHDISLTLSVDAGVDIEDITCHSHAIDTTYDGPSTATVVLSPNDTIPNKDFVLRYRVAGERIKSSLMVHRDGDGGYFTMMLYPPADLRYMHRQPMELIFVLDCSGSMRGQPLALAKAAVERALQRLEPQDSFQIVRFSSNASQMGPAPLRATPGNIRRGLAYLAGLDSGGGTMMIEGIKAALEFDHDPERFRVVSFMTDGYIGNEQEILAAIIERVGDARLFSFGVGSSVNRYLLDGMARVGRGAVAYIGLDGNTLAAVDGFYECLTYPAMTDLAVDWGSLQVIDVFPRRIPDLFAGRPVVLTGRFRGALDGAVRIEGRAGAETVVDVIDVGDDTAAAHPGIAAVWARMQIRDLARSGLGADDTAPVEAEITALALAHNLMSQYTSFVAVDSLSDTAGDHGTTVQVPVRVPAGVRYDTTVGR